MTSVAENGSVDAKEAKTKLNATEGSKDELSELLAKYKSHIEILKSWTKDVLVDDPDTESGTLYDDIWILRYVLSNAKDPTSEKGLKQAENAIRRSILWRKENAATLKKIKGGGAVPFDDFVKKYLSVFRSFGKDGGPINFVSLKHSNPGGLMDTASFEQVEEYLVMTKEEDMIICDRETRRLRKLVKMVSVIDMHDYGLFSGGSDRRFAKALGNSSNTSSDLYPQLLGMSIVCNTPTFITWLVRLMKLFLSDRTFSKVKFLTYCGHGEPPESGKLSDFVEVDDDQVPDFLNGSLDSSKLNLVRENSEKVDEAVSITIPARTCNECRLVITEAGSMIAYLIAVKDRNVIVSAYLNNDDGEPIVLFEPRKVDASEGTLIGTWKAPLPGKLVIKFDNSYSRFRSKTVRYCIKLVSDKDKEIEALSDSDGM